MPLKLHTSIRNLLNPAIYTILYAAHLLSDWFAITISNIRAPGLGDLRFVLDGFQLCRIDGPLQLSEAIEVVITNFCPEYTYGRGLFFATWLLGEFSDLGESLQATSIALSLTLVMTLGFLFSKELIGQGARPWMAGLASFSPAMVLLYERTNFDLVMALMIILTGYLISKNHALLAIFVIFLSAVFKFYTLPLLWLFIIFFKSKPVKLASLLLACIATVAVVQDIQRINSLVPVQGTVQFGFPAFEHYFDEIGLDRLAAAAPFMGFALPVILSITLALKKSTLPVFAIIEPTMEKISSRELIKVLSSVTFLACYFTGLSYDYRLVFLVIAGVLYISGGAFTRFQEQFLWLVLITALWGSTAFGLGLAKEVGGDWIYVVGIGQVLGDLSVLAWTTLLLTSHLLGVKSWLTGRTNKSRRN